MSYIYQEADGEGAIRHVSSAYIRWLINHITIKGEGAIRHVSSAYIRWLGNHITIKGTS